MHSETSAADGLPTLWWLTSIPAWGWSLLVTLHFVFNNYKSEICGAGFLELLQAGFLILWLPVHLGAFFSGLLCASHKPRFAALELATLGFLVFALWAQFQWAPECSSYQ